MVQREETVYVDEERKIKMSHEVTEIGIAAFGRNFSAMYEVVETSSIINERCDSIAWSKT